MRAVVIGGTGGIGIGIAEALTEKGWQVTVTGASGPEIDAFAETGLAAETALLDVTDDGQVAAFFGALDRLDGLVNCAGILRKQDEFEIDVFRQVLEVNLTGTMRTCLAAHPLLTASGGAIVNTGSMYSLFGGPHAPAYTASKGGVAQLTKALAGAWAGDGIRVNAIAPGWIDTPMTSPIREDPERQRRIMERLPQARWGKPGEVGALAAWLLSPEASLITGTVIPADGGYSAM